MSKQIKICQVCDKTFYPQLTDEAVLHLWYDEDYIDKARFLEEEYKVQGFRAQLEAPLQALCDTCSSDPDVYAGSSLFSGGVVRYYKKEPKPKADETTTE